MRARPALLGLLALMVPAAGAAIAADSQKPTLAVALGMTPEQVSQRADLAVRWELKPLGETGRRTGGVLINTPHRLVYEDRTLRLELLEAGNYLTMPTGIMVFQDAVNLVSASVLGEYVNLETAISASRKLLGDLKAQGFVYGIEDAGTLRFPKFLLARKNGRAMPPPPRTVESFEEMERAFLNSRYYVEEVAVFRLEKDDLAVRLRMTNMRRRHTESSGQVEMRVERELRELDEKFLRNERAYYLEVSISRRTQ